MKPKAVGLELRGSSLGTAYYHGIDHGRRRANGQPISRISQARVLVIGLEGAILLGAGLSRIDDVHATGHDLMPRQCVRLSLYRYIFYAMGGDSQ